MQKLDLDKTIVINICILSAHKDNRLVITVSTIDEEWKMSANIKIHGKYQCENVINLLNTCI